MVFNPAQLRESELRTAVAILILEGVRIPRAAIRLLLPKGEPRVGKKNTVSHMFLNALREFEREGYLVRHETSVTINSQDAFRQLVYRNLTSAMNAGYVHGTLERSRQLSGDYPVHLHELKAQVDAILLGAAESAP